MGLDLVSGMQINQMRQHVAAGGGQQGGRSVGVDLRGKACCIRGGTAQGCHDLCFAAAAVGDQLGQSRGGVGDRIAMTREHLRPGPPGQKLQ